MLTFRIDDISVNTDLEKLSEMVRLILARHPEAKIILGVSLIVSNEVGERVFPKVWNAFSDHRIFYKSDRVGMPNVWVDSIVASHGLVHIDHRLLSKEAQEMSILTSCSILKSKIFIPPFNKWDGATEDVCKSHGIDLIKFEDGWNNIKYESNSPQVKWYFHTHYFDLLMFKASLCVTG
jgi:hypothetical protein